MTTVTNIVRESALHHEQSIRLYPRLSEQNALCTPTERQANRREMSAAQDNIGHDEELQAFISIIEQLNVAFEHTCRKLFER
jgi:hypothetical protein